MCFWYRVSNRLTEPARAQPKALVSKTVCLCCQFIQRGSIGWTTWCTKTPFSTRGWHELAGWMDGWTHGLSALVAVSYEKHVMFTQKSSFWDPKGSPFSWNGQTSVLSMRAWLESTGQWVAFSSVSPLQGWPEEDQARNSSITDSLSCWAFSLLASSTKLT